MSFEAIYGHQKNKKEFKVLLKDDKLSHSYIFEGKKGVGKKLFATTVAKALLCLNKVDDACEHCRSCLKINHKNHPDFLMIEPDGNSIKNDQIKDFQDFLKILPNESDNKIVVINKSHTMTPQAQNTILKILEEPPAYALIILISENADKLLPTINSRAQTIKFNNLKEEEISEFLIDQYDATPEEVKLISVFSNGSIERAIASYNSEAFIELRQKTIDLLNAMIINDKFFVINHLSFFKKNKEQIDLILELMMTWFRDLLVLKETNNDALIINQDKRDILKKHTFKADHLNFVEIINKIKDTKININEYNVNYDISIENLIFSIIN